MTTVAGPRLALGTVQWGLRYGIANRAGRPAEDEVRRLLAAARDAGLDTLDTARAYGDSEAVLGQLVGPDPYWKIFTKLSPDVVNASGDVARSLACLRRPRLDAVLLHRSAHRTAAHGAVWDTLRRARDAGLVGQIGVSAASPDEAETALDDPEVEMIQVATNLLDQRLTRADYFARAAARGRKVVVRSVFLQGVAHLPLDQLPDHFLPIRPVLEHIHRWAGEREGPAWHAFVAFARTLDAAYVLVGCETADQLAANLTAWQVADRFRSEIPSLAASVPDLPESILNPSRWPAG